MADPTQSFKKLPPWGKLAVGAGGLVVVYMVYRSRSAATATSAAPAAAASGTGTDPAGNTGVIDPATGYVYGSPQDQAALAGQSGGGQYVSAYNAAGYNTGTVGTASAYGTNAQWAQAAEAGLSQVGYDPVTVANDLGAYLAGQRLTSGQAAVVWAAIAEYGQPPEGAPPVTLVSATGPAVTGNTPPPAPSPSPAPATGKAYPSSPSARPPVPPSRIDISGVTSTSVSCHWTDVPGATSYAVQVTYQGQTVKSFAAGSYSAVISGLTPDHTYGIHVSSVGPGGTSSPAATWAKTAR